MEKRKKPTEFDIRSRERLNYMIAKYCNGSQQELAKRTGVGKASISQYVNGKNTPSNLTALALCTPFNVNPAWLMGFDVPMKCEDMAPTAGIALTYNEKILVNKFRLLNEEGQSIVIDIADGMVSSGKYIKTDQGRMVD